MRHRWLHALGLGLALALTAACQTTAPNTPPAAQALDGRLAALAAESGAPGLVAGVYREGRLTAVYDWGGADCAGNGVIDPAADFEIGSISKHMSAVGLLLLWEQHRVDLDAALGAYLSDVPEAWGRVTLRQLLTHTSGVPDYEEAGGYGVYETSPTPQQIFDIVRDRPLDFEPGTQWNYSNTGYVLLSLVIERVSGMHFGEYMQANVFAPLRMMGTFESGYGPADAVLAQGCRPGEGEAAARIPVRPISEASTYGAGGIYSTVADWARWYDALNTGALLSPAAMREMFTPVTLPDGSVTGYGFGMEVQDFRGEPRRGHSGQTQGFVADYASFPNRRLAILVLANTYGADTSPLMQALQLREMPDLRYERLVVPLDPDPPRSALIRRALEQAVLNRGGTDLLSDHMRAFATSADAAPLRAQLQDVLVDMARFEFLRASAPANGNYMRYLYRATGSRGASQYITVAWLDGKLLRLRREVE